MFHPPSNPLINPLHKGQQSSILKDWDGYNLSLTSTMHHPFPSINFALTNMPLYLHSASTLETPKGIGIEWIDLFLLPYEIFCKKNLPYRFF